jgi:hypothetical protein
MSKYGDLPSEDAGLIRELAITLNLREARAVTMAPCSLHVTT